jgi:hypothetical protein
MPARCCTNRHRLAEQEPAQLGNPACKSMQGTCAAQPSLLSRSTFTRMLHPALPSNQVGNAQAVSTTLWGPLVQMQSAPSCRPQVGINDAVSTILGRPLSVCVAHSTACALSSQFHCMPAASDSSTACQPLVIVEHAVQSCHNHMLCKAATTASDWHAVELA